MIFWDTLNGLLVLTFVLAYISLYITKKINGTLISAASAYWFGWIFLLVGAKFAVSENWIDELGRLELYYISVLNFGAFLGFLISSLLCKIGNSNIDRKKFEKLYYISKFIVERVSIKFLIPVFIFGLIFLIQRIVSVGFNLEYFTNVRLVYLERNFVLISWIATHIFLILNVVIILAGLKDSVDGLNLKFLVKIILFSAPLFLANGTRTFLLGPIITYLASFFLIRGINKFNRKFLTFKEFKNISILLISSLLIFSIIGFTRGGYGEKFEFLSTVLGWPISTMGALNSWIDVAIVNSGTNGLLTFDWFSNFMHQIGILDFTEELRSIDFILFRFTVSNDSAGVIPRSILPDLIFDFGENGVFPAIFIISFLLQTFTLKFVSNNIFSHSIAVMCLISSFMTIQTSILSPGFVVTIFWSYIFYLFFERKILNNFKFNKL